MKHVSPFLKAKLRPQFPSRHLDTKGSRWEYYMMNFQGSFRLLFSFGGRSFLHGGTALVHTPWIWSAAWRWEHGIYQLHWLQLLHFFPDTKDLYVSKEITGYIASALNKIVGERTTEVLPASQNIFFYEYEELSGPTDFIAARELSVAVSQWFAHWDM